MHGGEYGYILIPDPSTFKETLEELLLIFYNDCRLYCNRGALMRL